MITLAILSLVILSFIVFSLIGLFNKKIRHNMRVVIFHLKKFRVNRKNIRKLRRQARQTKHMLRRQRFELFWKKLSKSYQIHLDTKKPAP